MNLGEWAATMRAAARPLDLADIRASLDRITNAASALCDYSSAFIVQRTGRGVRIHATNPSPNAARALKRALDQEMPRLREDARAAVKGRMQP